MKAIVKTPGGTQLLTVPEPQLTCPADVKVKVRAVGLCRTDISVADNLIQTPIPLILGHEFAGTVTHIGTDVTHLKVGDAVAAMPIVPCLTCHECTSGQPDLCQHSLMCGVERDGAFAEYVVLPANLVYKVAPHLSFTQAAYAEPIAASLAVTKSGIQPHHKGLIYGENRISELTLLILKAKGFTQVHMVSPFDTDTVNAHRNSYDFIIETLSTDTTMAAMQNLVRPGGTIVLKSRKHQPVGININQAVRKEIRFISVNYGNFAEGLEMLANGSLNIDHLIGECWPIESFEAMFTAGRSAESKKQFMVFG